MENMLLFQIDKMKDGKIIKTYKIYTNGDTDGFEEDGVNVLINNEFRYCCSKGDAFLAAASPKIASLDD